MRKIPTSSEDIGQLAILLTQRHKYEEALICCGYHNPNNQSFMGLYQYEMSLDESILNYHDR